MQTTVGANRESAKHVPTLVILITATLFLAACGAAPDNSVTSEDIRAITEEAYVFSFPILAQYKMLFAQALYEESGAYEAPLNILKHKTELLGPEYTLIVRPNNDTLYSAVWLDLRAEPMVLSVPTIPLERYYSFQFIDLYTHNFDYIGSRTTGPRAGSYMIAGPGRSGNAPDGIDGVIRCVTAFAMALARTAVFGPEDVPNVAAIQKQYSVTPLSEFRGAASSPRAADPPQLPSYSLEQARSAGFVSLINAFLPYVGRRPGDEELWQRFETIGIGDFCFDPEAVDPNVRTEMEAGVAAALERIETEAQNLGSLQNGWMLVEASFGNRDVMQGRSLLRAGAAFFGLWGNGNSGREAIYPISGTVSTSGGEPHRACVTCLVAPTRSKDATLPTMGSTAMPIAVGWSGTMWR